MPAALVVYFNVLAAAVAAGAGQTPPVQPPAGGGGPSFERELERASELLAKNPSAALKAFTKLQQTRPGTCLECLLGIAAAQNRTEQFAEAERTARKVLELTDQPEAELIAYNLIGVAFYDRTPLDGSAALLEQNMTQAEVAFREAHRLDQGKTESVRWNLASALEWLGRPEAKDLFSDPMMPALDWSDHARSAGNGEVIKPVVLTRVRPEYPGRARRQRVEGVVVLETVIDATGEVVYVRVVEGLRGCTMESHQVCTPVEVPTGDLRGRAGLGIFHADHQLQSPGLAVEERPRRTARTTRSWGSSRRRPS